MSKLPVKLFVGAGVKCITRAPVVVKHSALLADHRNLGIIGIIGGPGSIIAPPGITPAIGAIKPVIFVFRVFNFEMQTR